VLPDPKPRSLGELLKERFVKTYLVTRGKRKDLWTDVRVLHEFMHSEILADVPLREKFPFFE